MKTFNTTAVCIPSKHNMVDLGSRLVQIKKMVDDGKYFTINRARQYGKTTTLTALSKFLTSEYLVISLDFQGIGNAGFSSEEDFVQSFCRLIKREKRSGLEVPKKIYDRLEEILYRKEHRAKMDELFDDLMDWCELADNKIVLMIDEVDSATNNQVFLDFLALLRDGYISRDTKGAPAFQSVILAGVTDIKNLKRKIRPEEAHRFNSPWNTHEGNEPSECLHSFGDCPWDQRVFIPFDIAADYLVDMSF